MIELKDCLVVVMAAGEAKRFGNRKLYLDFAGKPLIYHVLDRLKDQSFGQVLVVVQPGDQLDTDFPVIVNPDYQTGQSSSIRAAMTQDLDWEAVFFCPADQPFLDVSVMQAMVSLYQPGKIVVPRFGDRKGSPVLFSQVFREELLSLSGEEGGRPIIRRHPEALVYYDVPNEDLFFDIDTVDDLVEAQRRVTNPSPHKLTKCDKVMP